jgi:hypothetical protein
LDQIADAPRKPDRVAASPFWHYRCCERRSSRSDARMKLAEVIVAEAVAA